MIHRHLTACLLLVISSCATPANDDTAPYTCAAPGDLAAELVKSARAAFNKAIVEEDIDSIAAILTENAILVSGTDSMIFPDRTAQLAIWREDFEAGERTIYQRLPDCISVSPILPIATERGAWRGVQTGDARSYAGGVYMAKWRQVGETWQLEAEIFSTEFCGGDFCPQEEPK